MSDIEPTVPEWLYKEGFTIIPRELYPVPFCPEDDEGSLEIGAQRTIAWFRKQMHDAQGEPTYEMRVQHIWQTQKLHKGPTRVEIFIAHAAEKTRADRNVQEGDVPVGVEKPYFPYFDMDMDIFDEDMSPCFVEFDKRWEFCVKFRRKHHLEELRPEMAAGGETVIS